MTPDQALIISRFVIDTCALLLWGAHAFLWLGVSPPLAEKLHARLGFVLPGAIVLLVLAATAKIAIQAAILGNGWSDAFDLSLIHDLITATRSGLALAVQAALSCLLLMRWLLFPKRRMVTTTILAGLVLASFSISGHAAMNGGPVGLLHQLNDSLHLLTAGAWIGALAPVLLLLTTRPDERDWESAISALMRFSTFGHGAVAATLITGVINSRLIIGQFWLDTTVPFQRLLLVKIIVVAMITAIACINRYGFVPHMALDRTRALRLLRLGTVLEITLALIAIALVASFGTMPPVADAM
ncbi:copper homeostasis membrane protein CopD [Rhizobium sp.]|uniref:copper homeostasis membrane protein CopD n=1 Tax=Rhizobium sp. TaxID=391 RepID=UPI000E952B82|nr:copper-binding protein [Rhizobium sp.]